MPIYEYTCRKCNAHLEVMRKVSDKPLSRHAGCGGKLEKEWSRTGFQFKGTGWYVTDYAGRKSDATEAKDTQTDTKATKDAKETKEATAPKGDTSTDASVSSNEKSEKKGKASKSSKTKSVPAGGD